MSIWAVIGICILATIAFWSFHAALWTKNEESDPDRERNMSGGEGNLEK